MSSAKGKGTATYDDDWSEWVWDHHIQQYYRTRVNPRAEGGYDYEYAPAQTTPEVPRSEAGKTKDTTDSYYSSTSATTNTPYYEQQTYKYDTSSGKSSIPFSYANTRASSSAPVESNMEYWNSNRFKATHDKIPEITQDSSEVLTSTFKKLAISPIPPPSGSGLTYSLTTGGASSSSGQALPDVGIGSSKSLQVPNNTERHIFGTPGESELLDPRFKVHKSKYFKPGQVFKVLWSEPEGDTRADVTNVTAAFIEGKLGQKVYQSVRRFIVVATPKRGGSSCCIPILTYGHQGTAKPGVVASSHAIVYTGDTPPKELPGEPRLFQDPIQVIPKTFRDKLDVESRINYAKIYTVEHNVKVYFVGELSESSVKRCMTAFNNTWNNMYTLDG